MKANEFVKEFGWGEAKRIVNSKAVKLGLAREIADWKNIDFDDLKRLVESHELVESFGGLDLARKVAHKNCFEFNAPLLKAIADVESCQ